MVRNLAIDALRCDAPYRRIAGEDVEVAERIVEDKAPSAEQALEMHRIGGHKIREIA